MKLVPHTPQLFGSNLYVSLHCVEKEFSALINNLLNWFAVVRVLINMQVVPGNLPLKGLPLLRIQEVNYAQRRLLSQTNLPPSPTADTK